ncbi:unnamed protein product [Schistosoma curassoni]|uniref:Protein kinase domain-containing protein n=1 Tax=Schistosoma curassoni TaxID=6186 RepID=A0A183JU25_9TREM|nr:unnamed protein product [Schistosoma curassoni]
MNASYRYVSNQSDSNRYIQSHHYYYSQTINLNQPLPVVNGMFKDFDGTKNIEQELSLKYYESQVSAFYADSQDELFAVKWFDESDEGKRNSLQVKSVHLLLHSL